MQRFTHVCTGCLLQQSFATRTTGDLVRNAALRVFTDYVYEDMIEEFFGIFPLYYSFIYFYLDKRRLISFVFRKLNLNISRINYYNVHRMVISTRQLLYAIALMNREEILSAVCFSLKQKFLLLRKTEVKDINLILRTFVNNN